MNKVEAFDKAWRLAFREKDFSLVDEIYHPEYSAFDRIAGVKVNLEADKITVSTIREMIVVGPSKIIFEDENSLYLQRFMKFKEAEIFTSVTSDITYKDGKIFTQSSDSEELDIDPSEGQHWKWEDYE
jgi:hypothetical protein